MLTALPVARGDTPSRPSSSSGFNGNYMPPPGQHQDNGPPMMLPYSNGPMQGHPQHMHHPPPPQWTGDHMMYPPPHPAMSFGGHQPTNAYHHQGSHPHYPGQLTPSHSNDNLAPAAELNGLPPSKSDVYHDEFGHAHPIHVAMKDDVDMEPPTKKQKPDPTIQEEEDDDDEVIGSKPLPASMTLATKPSRSRESSSTQAFRSKLLSLFRQDIDDNVRRHLDLDDEIPQDIDMVIDDNGHTALHWAASLGKISIVEQLIQLGADIHRGNVNGETPLARALLTANNADSGTLADLLQYLAPSIRTIDRTYRTIIHHIALVSSVPGRATYARIYLAGILEWVAKGQVSSASTEVIGTKMNLKSLVDVQDEYGDTALIVAARAGNKGIVKLLLDAGADKTKANKMGLKALDFGVEVEVSLVSELECNTDVRLSHSLPPKLSSPILSPRPVVQSDTVEMSKRVSLPIRIDLIFQISQLSLKISTRHSVPK
jgi:regulatory protein SWI6